MKIEEKLYFAYGSNMNLDQMAYRCPAAEAVCTAKLEGYELFFAGRPGNGVASIRPKQGGTVVGVLWKLTEACEKSLDHYEAFPALYGKETVRVRGSDGVPCDGIHDAGAVQPDPRNAVHGISGGDPCRMRTERGR